MATVLADAGSLDVFILKQEVGDLGIATLEILEAITVDWPQMFGRNRWPQGKRTRSERSVTVAESDPVMQEEKPFPAPADAALASTLKHKKCGEAEEPSRENNGFLWTKYKEN